MGNCSKKQSVECAELDIGYTDPDFPASSQSLRPTLPGREKVEKTHTFQIKWHRIGKVFEHGLLFRQIEPNCIIQGDVGDCWLMSAMAAIAEFPGYVESLFVFPDDHPGAKSSQDVRGVVSSEDLTRRASAVTPLHTQGKYDIWMFDPKEKVRKMIRVDDFIPFKVGPQYLIKYGHYGKPYFSQPREGEAWCLLLEKAFAKFLGSYGNLDGGDQLFALMCLTGSSELFSFRCGKYERNPEHQDGKDGKPLWCEYRMTVEDPRDPNSTMPHFSGNRHSNSEIMDLIHLWDQKNYVMGALIVADEEGKEAASRGLVEMHAYSLISIAYVEIAGKHMCLLLMRNPWGGKYEWKGDWSDESDMWEKYPNVTEQLQPKRIPDGMFWISREDFLKHFNYVCVCQFSMENGRSGHHEYVGNVRDASKERYKTFRKMLSAARSFSGVIGKEPSDLGKDMEEHKSTEAPKMSLDDNAENISKKDIDIVDEVRMDQNNNFTESATIEDKSDEAPPTCSRWFCDLSPATSLCRSQQHPG